MSLESLPSFVLAGLALSSALVWQTAGALAIYRLTPRSLSRLFRLGLAWLLWLPASGGMAMAFVMAGVASRGLLLACIPLVLLLALTSWREVSPLVAEVVLTWKSWRDTAAPFERWLFRLGVALQVVGLAFAAHPQRIYDQLNYHLVVGHLVVRDGAPFSAWDPHVSFAGVVEYAFAWHAAWSDSRLLLVATAQVAVLLATLPVLVGCGLALGRTSLGLFGLSLVALPGLLPESVVFHMAKPDGIILTGVVLLLTLLIRAPSGWLWLAGALGALLFAAKLTFGHALVGLVAAFVVVRPPLGRLREALPLLGVGALCLLLQLGKNYVELGNPFYPAAASLFPSAASDATTAAYWTQVAFGDGSHLWGFLGPLALARRALGLVLSLVVAGMLLWRTPRAPEPRAGSSCELYGVLAFLLAFWLAWPLFYGAQILPRFVGSFAGGLLVLLCLIYARLDALGRRRLQIVCAACGLLSAHLDQSVPGLIRKNTRSAYAAYLSEWPRLATAVALNPCLHPSDTVVTDRPEKLFFDSRLLFEAPLSPSERRTLAELARDPVATAARAQVKAIIVDKRRPMSPELAQIWKGLAENGQIDEVGNDRVLSSVCYFQRSCPGVTLPAHD